MSRNNLVALILALMVPYGMLVHSLRQSAAAEKAVAVQLTEQARPATEVAEHRANAARFERQVALLNMALMWFALYAGLGPITGRFLDKGALEVTEQLRAAERRSEHAHQELEEARAALEKIDVDVEAIRDRERKAAEAERGRLEGLARKEATQIEAHAELSVVRELKHAKEDLVERVASRAVAAAVAELRGDLDDDIRGRLQQKMIEGVGA